jgi:hypothetical protein
VVPPSDGTVISGTALSGNTIVVASSDGREIGRTQVGTDGSWKLTPATPVAVGTMLDVAQLTPEGTLIGRQTLRVGKPAVAAPARLVLGGTLDIVATGFQPGEIITGEVHSTPLPLGSLTAGADGSARFTRVITAGELEPGNHAVVLTAPRSGTLSAPLVVAAADASVAALASETAKDTAETTPAVADLDSKEVAAPKTTAKTGGGLVGPRLVLALVMIALGLAAWSTSRRRQAVR